ncbi:AAA family ATPase [Thalassobacillus sp. B23F22_16]|uniref:AAA family ATPase n=1 Tax=Thalassobacillus sp. B23F22_16 TaxID=3459513 RepID=UPI00373E6D86
MKITYIHIYGFGKWQNFTLHLEKTNFPIMIGKNEAGKSTIRKFILFVLFGLPPKQREFYQPKTGGTVGGRMELLLDNGEKMMVERLHDRNKGAAVCLLPDGTEKEESYLQALLGMGRNTYESIFSFEAADLTDLHKIDQDDLGETLLNIGLTGSTRINETERTLGQQLSERFRPQGKKPPINQRLQELDKINEKLKDMEREEASYQQLNKEQQETKDHLELLRHQKETIQEDLFRLQRLLQVKDVVLAYHQYASSRIEKPVEFPVDGKERLHALKDQLLPLESEQQLVRQHIQENEQRLENVQNSMLSPKLMEEMKELSAALPDIQDSIRKEEELKERIRKYEYNVTRELKELNINLTQEALANYDFPFFLEEEWAQAARQKERLEGDEERVKEQEYLLSAQEKHIEDRRAEWEDQLLDESSYHHYITDLEAFEQKQRRGGGNEGSASDKRQRQAKQTFGLTAALAAIGLLTAWLLSSLPVAMFAILMLIGGYYIYRQSTSLGPELSQESDVSNLSEEEYYLFRKKVDQHEKASYELDHLQDQWQRSSVERMKLEEQKQSICSRRERLNQLIEEQRKQYPFLEVSPVHWGRLYHAVKPLQEQYRQAQELKEEVASLENERKKYTVQLETFLTAAGWEWNDNQLSALIGYFHEGEKAVQETDRDRVRLEVDIEDLREKKKQLEIRMLPFKREKNSLFEAAGSENEQDFLQIAEAAEAERNRRDKREDLRRQLTTILKKGDIEGYQVMEKVPDYQLLEQQLTQLQEKLQHVEEERDSRRQELADLHNKLSKLEHAASFSEQRHQLQAKRDELQAEAREWAVLQTAYNMLLQTKEVYQHTYLPDVLDRASDLFSRLTEEAYHRVHFHPEQGDLQIETADGFSFSASELSRGTADQLYVALRLSLSAVLSSEERLPFLIDDAFVHFDRTRTGVMMDIIKELTVSHQVFLFTTREDLADNTSGAATIKLSDRIAGGLAN